MHACTHAYMHDTIPFCIFSMYSRRPTDEQRCNTPQRGNKHRAHAASAAAAAAASASGEKSKNTLRQAQAERRQQQLNGGCRAAAAAAAAAAANSLLADSERGVQTQSEEKKRPHDISKRGIKSTSPRLLLLQQMLISLFKKKCVSSSLLSQV